MQPNLSSARLLSGDNSSNFGSERILSRESRPYVVSQLYTATQISSSAVGVVYGALSFTADQLPKWSSFATIFDRYRIREVEVFFQPQTNQMVTSTGAAVFVPRLSVCVDFDDATAPGTVAEVQAYGNAITVPGNRPVVRHFIPRAAGLAYKTAITSAYTELDPHIWKDVAYGDMPHYGLKWALTNTIAAGDMSYYLTVRMTVEFAGAR